ncbi:MAG: hypothetical protein IJW78_03005 [Clostridia bacterium]|nr:hypothetical protein [Clostridia bacterium]
MKRLLCLLLISAILTLSFSPAVFAETHSLAGGISIALPEDYTLLTDNNLNKNKETIAELGHSVTSLRNYMEENHILFIATDKENENQVQMGAVQTDFSKDIGDLSGLKADDLETIGNQLISSGFEIISVHDWIYYKTKVDGLVGYATVQYITLKNDTLYTLNYYGSDATVANEIISGLTIPDEKSTSDSKSIFLSVLLWLALVAAVVTIVVLIISLFLDLRKKREDNDVREYIRIKRRWKF